MSEKRPSGHPAESRPRIVLVNADRAMGGLLAEWLSDAGYRVVSRDALDQAAREEAALTIIDVPITRERGCEALGRMSTESCGTPILVLSPTFFSNVQWNGECARALGVAGVLPKPITRDALVSVVDTLLRRAG
jgi:DNA-binding response OmpR family regulator